MCERDTPTGVLERHQGDGMEETFKMWKTILTDDLHRLEQLKGLDQASQERYALKEQDIGLHCYQAEEHLPDADLTRLKKVLRLPELRWGVYKSKLRRAPA
jgi:hypothetical protein